MEEHAEKRGVQALLNIAEVVTESLAGAGIEADQAREIGLRAADRVRVTYGGQPLYVPKGTALVLSERDREIFQKFDGSNHYRLAREYDLTVRQIYSIVARVRDEEFRRRQMGLFAQGE